jgi:proteasome-associated ATPase
VTSDLPIAAAETRRHGGTQPAIDAMIMSALGEMYSAGEQNRFLEVTYANGDKAVLYFHDFVSGAMIESIVRRAKKFALKRYLGGAEKGLSTDDLLAAVREEFTENEDLPNTTHPDDWAKIAGKKGERVVSVKSLVGQISAPKREVEEVVNTGQYL